MLYSCHLLHRTRLWNSSALLRFGCELDSEIGWGDLWKLACSTAPKQVAQRHGPSNFEYFQGWVSTAHINLFPWLELTQISHICPTKSRQQNILSSIPHQECQQTVLQSSPAWRNIIMKYTVFQQILSTFSINVFSGPTYITY